MTWNDMLTQVQRQYLRAQAATILQLSMATALSAHISTRSCVSTTCVQTRALSEKFYSTAALRLLTWR